MISCAHAFASSAGKGTDSAQTFIAVWQRQIDRTCHKLAESEIAAIAATFVANAASAAATPDAEYGFCREQ